MAKSQHAIAPASAPVAAPAPVGGAPEAAAPAKTEKVSRKIVSGPALDLLVAAGAVLVPLPSKGKLHDKITSQLGGSCPASELAKRVAPLSKGWDQFDRGYLVGPSASYSACAVTTGSKKAKAKPAFVWAVKGDDAVTLYSPNGQVWSRPAKGDREQGVYDAALAAATAALA